MLRVAFYTQLRYCMDSYMVILCLFRLAVRTSRCGRDNPGSNPGRDTSCFDFLLHPHEFFAGASLWRDVLSAMDE